MDYSDIKVNDLVCFEYKKISYTHKIVKGYILSNERDKILIRWYGISDGSHIFPSWNFAIIKHEDIESSKFMKLGVAKYPTVYRPALFGIILIYGFLYFFGSLISGILGTISLGFGGAMAFILAKNFKKIKNFRIKKNITILEPINKEVDQEYYATKMTSILDDKKIKLIQNESVNKK